MIETYTVFLIGGYDDEEAVFEAEEAGDKDVLRCIYRGKTIERTDDDTFGALCAIRKELAKENLTPFCYGASLNVYPSPMSRDMGGGFKAYKLTMGQPGRLKDLADIFDAGPDIVPASVELQEQYYSDWLASLGN